MSGSIYVSGKLLTYPSPALSQRQHFSFTAKCWLKGGVGGQFPRNLGDQLVQTKFVKRASWVVDKDTICCLCVILKFVMNKRKKSNFLCYVLDPGCNADFQL